MTKPGSSGRCVEKWELLYLGMWALETACLGSNPACITLLAGCSQASYFSFSLLQSSQPSNGANNQTYFVQLYEDQMN